MSLRDVEVIDADQIRMRQEQRVVSARQALDEARVQLASAMALVETLEQEYQSVQNDAGRKLSALELVLSMAGEPDDHVDSEPAETTVEDTDDHGQGQQSLIPKRVVLRWRPVFSGPRPEQPGSKLEC